MEYLLFSAYLIGAFLIGSIPFGWLIVKATKGIDLRTVGSGNIGATNAGRVAGKTAFAAVLLLDLLKGLIVVVLIKTLSHNQSSEVIVGLAAILGHCFPPFLGFRGGKGVATTFGVVIALQPITALACLMTWLVAFGFGRYVSIASIAGATSLGLAQIFLPGIDLPVRWILGLLGLLIVIKHAKNIHGLFDGTEKPFQFAGSSKPVCEVGFIVHDVKDDPAETKKRIAKRFPILSALPANLLHYVIFPRLPLSLLRAGYALTIESPTGAKANMVFWALPKTPKQMMSEQPVEAIAKAAMHCHGLGARLCGLGAFTSIVGQQGGGKDIADIVGEQGIGITSGNSLTAGSGVEGLLEMAHQVGYDPAECTAVVIGAGGSIGSVAAQLLARSVKRVLLVGRPGSDLSAVLVKVGPKACQLTLEEALPQAELVITVTSETEASTVNLGLFRPGAIVCDIARPRNIGVRIAEERPDVLVFEGAILNVPGPNLEMWDFGFPPNTSYACMAETMILGLEKRFGNFSLGKELDLAQVDEIVLLAKKHGFTLAGFRSFDQAVPRVRIESHQRLVTRLKTESSRATSVA